MCGSNLVKFRKLRCGRKGNGNYSVAPERAVGARKAPHAASYRNFEEQICRKAKSTQIHVP